MLNIGEEDCKGNELARNTNKMLREHPEINFFGNVEGRDIITGHVDVVVCDGFVGNVVLKLTEGVASMIMKSLKQELSSSMLLQLWVTFLAVIFQRFKKTVDHEEYGVHHFSD